MVFDRLLDPIFNPLLVLGPLWALVIMSFFISLVIIIIYKYTTDQNLMKQLKEELKEIQKEMKDLKDKPQEAMKVQKRAMQTNMKYMMQSMKSTLFTFIPIIILFGWLNAHLAFVPLMPNEEFTISAFFDKQVEGSAEIIVPGQIEVMGDIQKEIINGQADWTLSGEAGKYTIGVEYNERSYMKNLIIDDQNYEKIDQKYKGDVKSIRINNDSLKVLNIFGWRLGWLGTYIILSILFSIGLRKVMKVY
ncbi:MAG: EMC3/TMCO1 family protein [Candidatus Woesearchaeota archaeon]|jgi:uncharacterized membrane protein (DUF106 family)|nr:EMC3/TMCO1 family protein [Candidatus Woesearchaeota archaeon]MDP7457963.1 EMC3/TMCO1 family protein [Candidatus Woesearchaeota archaeon]